MYAFDIFGLKIWLSGLPMEGQKPLSFEDWPEIYGFGMRVRTIFIFA